MLEYFRMNKVQYIVSGAGSKSNQYNKKKHQDFNPAFKEILSENQFAKVSEGYFEIEYTGDSVRVNASLYEDKPPKQLIKKDFGAK